MDIGLLEVEHNRNNSIEMQFVIKQKKFQIGAVKWILHIVKWILHN